MRDTDGPRVADAARHRDIERSPEEKPVWALDVGDPVGVSFPGMAFWFAGDAAQRVAAFSLHVHGGYGFMEEYDIQLFYRRARGWALVYDDPSREALRLAGRLFPEVNH